MLAGALAGLITGCAPVYYPKMLHVPLFSNAGETQLSGNITTTGYEAMAGVSPVENIGLIGAYAWNVLDRDSLPDDRSRYGEIALCYYPSVDTPDRSWLRWEIMGGYGRGSARSYSWDILHIKYDGDIYTVHSEYQRAFVQGHLAAQFQSRWLESFVELGWALRLAHLRFTTLSLGEESKDGASNIFLEHGTFLRIGIRCLWASCSVDFRNGSRV